MDFRQNLMTLRAVDKHNKQVYTYRKCTIGTICALAYAVKLDCWKQSLAVGLFRVPVTAF